MNADNIWRKPFLLIVFINTVIFLSFNMSASGFPAYVTILGESNIRIGMVTSLSAVAALSIRTIAGIVIDNRGGKAMTLIGLLLLCAPVFCIVSSSIVIVLTVRFLQGAGWGIASTACSKLIANNLPPKRLSEGLGYAGGLSSIAAAFAPGIAIAIFENNGSNSMFSVVFLLSVVAALLFLTYCQKIDNKKMVINQKPQQYIAVNAIVPAVLMMTITMAYAPMVTFITSYAKELSLSSAKGFFLSYAFSTILTRPLTGLYVDRKNTIFPTTIALVASISALITLANGSCTCSFLTAGILAGIGTGAGMNALQTAAIKESLISMRGIAIATFLFGFDLGMAIGSMLAGILLNIAGYSKMFTIMSFPAILALFFVLITLKRRCAISIKKEDRF